MGVACVRETKHTNLAGDPASRGMYLNRSEKSRSPDSQVVREILNRFMSASGDDRRQYALYGQVTTIRVGMSSKAFGIWARALPLLLLR